MLEFVLKFLTRWRFIIIPICIIADVIYCVSYLPDTISCFMLGGLIGLVIGYWCGVADCKRVFIDLITKK